MSDSEVMRGLLRRMLAANPPDMEVAGLGTIGFFPGVGAYASQLTPDEAELIAELGAEIEAIRGYFRPAPEQDEPASVRDSLTFYRADK